MAIRTISFLVLIFTAFSALAEVRIDGDSVEKIDLQRLTGTYSNRLGFNTQVAVQEVPGQQDLFVKPEYEVIFGFPTGAFFYPEKFYIDLDAIQFREVRDNGDIVFEVNEDCDYNTCFLSSGEIIFKKTKSGSYTMKIELYTIFWDYEVSADEIEEKFGDKPNPELVYCQKVFPDIVASNVRTWGDYNGSPQCAADVTIWLGKGNQISRVPSF